MVCSSVCKTWNHLCQNYILNWKLLFGDPLQVEFHFGENIFQQDLICKTKFFF